MGLLFSYSQAHEKTPIFIKYFSLAITTAFPTTYILRISELSWIEINLIYDFLMTEPVFMICHVDQK